MEYIKRKHDESEVKPGMPFYLDNLTPHTYALGDSVFTYVTEYKEKILIHVRKFKVYDGKCYPSTVGIAISPSMLMQLLSDQQRVSRALDYSVFDEEIPFSDGLLVTTDKDDQSVVMCKEFECRRGRVYKNSITLSYQQWRSLAAVKYKISGSILDCMYAKMDWQQAYEKAMGHCLDEKRTLDFDLIDDMNRYMYGKLATVLHRRLKTMSDYLGEVFEGETKNTVEMFDSAVMNLDVNSLVEDFYSATSATFIGQKKHSYVSETFLKSIDFIKLINEARIKFCCLEPL